MEKNIHKKLKSAKLDHLSEALNMEDKKVEELANILENNNLIEIHYPPFGKMELRKKEVKDVKNTQ